MAKLVLNPLTGKFDLLGMTSEEAAAYVLKAGDTMTGELIIDPSVGDEALTIKSGKRLVLDG